MLELYYAGTVLVMCLMLMLKNTGQDEGKITPMVGVMMLLLWPIFLPLSLLRNRE